jgi:hypothetical protein
MRQQRGHHQSAPLLIDQIALANSIQTRGEMLDPLSQPGRCKSQANGTIEVRSAEKRPSLAGVPIFFDHFRLKLESVL